MSMIRDIRYALRLLARSPGSSLLTVLVLAGGLGLSTFTFSFLHTAMIRAIPLPEGDRVVRLSMMEDGRRRSLDVADFEPLRAAVGTLSVVAGYTVEDVLLGRDDEARPLTVAAADPELFAIARTPAAIGRTLLPADAAAGAEPVIVLSHRVWRVAFGSAAGVVDRRVTINGIDTRIVGVMPEGFGFPVAEEAWMPLPARGATLVPGQSFLSVAARLAPGVTSEQAAAEATTLLRRSRAARPKADAPEAAAVVVESFPSAQFDGQPAIVFSALNAIAGLILLLSIVNAATLLTARANERLRETAVRLALGASSARIVVQGAWEGTLLCLASGVLGTAGAAWGLDAITRWTRTHMEANMAFWWVWQADRVTVLGSAAFVTLAIAALGALVSVRAVRVNVREVLQDGTAGAGSHRSGRLARALVVTQVATVTVLMFVGVLSAVMARRVLDLDPGYDPARLLQVDVPASSVPRFTPVEARDRLFTDVQARLAGHAALDGALLQTTLAGRDSAGGRFAPERVTASAPPAVAHVVATQGDLSVLQVAAVAGRLFGTGDSRSQQPVALISRSLAARHWPGRSPVGERLRFAAIGDPTVWRTIVGVVTDRPLGDPLAPDSDAIYLPLAQSPAADTRAIVRYRASEAAGRQALYTVLGEIDRALTPRDVFQMSKVLQQLGFMTISLAKLFGACFGFALLLAVVGTYGLMSTAIGQRTRELGVRRALGASDAMATRFLLTQGARQLGIGTVLAAPVLAVVGLASTRLLPLSAALATAIGVLVSLAIVGVVLGATWLPIRKALRVPLRTALLRD
jgi:predicted permease